MNGSHTGSVLMLIENASYPRDIRVRQEALALVSAGYRVSVICPAEAGQLWHEVAEKVDVYRYPSPRPGSGVAGYLWEYGYSMLAALLLSSFVAARKGVDIIHAANPPDTFVFIGALYKLLGKRYVFDHHDLAPELYRYRYGGGRGSTIFKVLLLLERLSCRLADHVIATNQSYRLVEIERDGVPPERVTVVRNGPRVRFPGAVASTEPPKTVGKTVIVYVGVMGVQDGVDNLVRVLGHLVHDVRRTDFTCILVGSGESLPGLKELADQLGIASYLHFAGWVPHSEVAGYLAKADICVSPEPSNPYTDRSTTIKMMEYMATGKPIVAFDLPEHRFSAGDAAVYVKGNDEREFARAIAELMDDPGRRQRMGAIGRTRVESELAWEHSVPKLLEAYSSLATRRRGDAYPRSAGDAQTVEDQA